MKKGLSKTTRSNIGTFLIVIIAYIVCEILLATGTMSSGLEGLLVPCCYYIILSVALNLVVGYLGELSLGHAGFMCVGAFSSAFFTRAVQNIITNQTVRFILAILIGAAVAALFGFLIGILIYYISDTAWGVLAGLGWTKMLYADTVVYFLALAAFNFKWEVFVVSHLRLEGRTARVLTWIGYVFVASNVVMLAANFFNNCYFYFDGQGNYVAGKWRFLIFIWLFCFNMMLAAFAFAKAVASSGIPRRQNLLVALFGLTMTSAIAV